MRFERPWRRRGADIQGWPVPRVLALMGDAAQSGGGRFPLVALLSIVASTLEGAALVMLAPVVRTLYGRTSEGTGLPALKALAAFAGIPGLLAFYASVAVLAAILVHVRTMAAARLVLDYGASLRTKLHQAVILARWDAPPLARPADLVHALTAETNQCSFAVQIGLNAVAVLAQLPPMVLAALALSPGLTLAALILGGAANLAVRPITRRAHAMAEAMAHSARGLNAEVTDELAGLRLIKVLGAERTRFAVMKTQIAETRRAQLVQTSASSTMQGVQRLAGAAAAATGAWYGITRLGLDPATLLALVLVFVRLTRGAAALQDQWRQMTRLLPVYDSLCARLEACRAAAEPAPTRAEQIMEAPRLRREMRFETIAYSYGEGQPPVFAGVSFVLPALTATALTGPSGVGKSTLADLAMGLVAPSAGRIFVDGAPLDGPARVAWRARVAYVPQDPFLFHDTIRANLLLARPEASEHELEAALDAAAADFVFGLPKGLDTIAGNRGTRLSGGERQRIALARALLQSPDLLVLDEATSALDIATEARVLATLRGLCGQTAILLIAHRPETIAWADRVLRFGEDGILTVQVPYSARAETTGATVR